MTFTIKKIEIIVMMASALVVSVPTWADEEIVPLIECAVQEKYERKSTCLGTGNLNDPARDPQVYFHNKCTTKIAVKQCFSFPNGTVVDSTETIKPSQTKRLFTCTKKANPNVPGPNMEPIPTKYHVWDPETDSGYKYKCD